MPIRSILLILGGLWTLLLLALLSPQVAYEAGSSEGDRAAIIGVLEAQQTAWNRGDVDAFLEGYWHSPELTFSGSGGIARGWDAVRTRYQQSYSDRDAMGQLQFSDLGCKVSGSRRCLGSGALAHHPREGRRRRSLLVGLAALSRGLADYPRSH